MGRHGYTVVQHVGYVRGGDPQMIRGLMSIKLQSDAQAAMVERVGGRVFRRYQKAEEWAQRQAYPTDYVGIIPIAQGRFAEETIDGLPIYIPPLDEEDS